MEEVDALTPNTTLVTAPVDSSHSHSVPPSNPSSAPHAGKMLAPFQDDDDDYSSSAIDSKQRQAPINPYLCPGRGHGNSAAMAAQSIATSNRFAALQEEDVASAPASSSVVTFPPSCPPPPINNEDNSKGHGRPTASRQGCCRVHNRWILF